jgi:hypothetical protein
MLHIYDTYLLKKRLRVWPEIFRREVVNVLQQGTIPQNVFLQNDFHKSPDFYKRHKRHIAYDIYVSLVSKVKSPDLVHTYVVWEYKEKDVFYVIYNSMTMTYGHMTPTYILAVEYFFEVGPGPLRCLCAHVNPVLTICADCRFFVVVVIVGVVPGVGVGVVVVGGGGGVVVVFAAVPVVVVVVCIE